MIYLMRDDIPVMQFGSFSCRIINKEFLPKELKNIPLEKRQVLNTTEEVMNDLDAMFQYAKLFLPEDKQTSIYSEIEQYLRTEKISKNKDGYWFYYENDIPMMDMMQFI